MNIPKFLRMVEFISKTGEFDTKVDSEIVNEVLAQLQEEGADIIDIKGTVSRSADRSTNIVYIVYDATAPIEIEEPEHFLWLGF